MDVIVDGGGIYFPLRCQNPRIFFVPYLALRQPGFDFLKSIVHCLIQHVLEFCFLSVYGFFGQEVLVITTPPRFF
jgi:hypothetical protein